VRALEDSMSGVRLWRGVLAVFCAGVCATAGALADTPVSADVEPSDDVLAEDITPPEESPTRSQDDELVFEVPEGRVELDKIRLDRLYRALENGRPRPQIRLSLQDCVAAALSANEDIRVVSYEPLKSDGDILAAKGEFDPLASFNAGYYRSSSSVSADVATFGGIPSIETYRTTTSASISGKLEWGTQYQASLDISKEETTFNNFVEEFSGGLTLSLTQPLLRGSGKGVNLARIRIARNNRRVAENSMRLTVMNTVAEVVKAYWDLVAAIETLNVRRESLDNAERLLDINKKRLEIGTAAALDVLQAKASVATRQSDVIAARSQVIDAEDRLKQLLNMRDDASFRPGAIIPIDRPNVKDLNLDEAESIQLALANRPELDSALLDIESAKLERRRAANELLPRFDLTGTVFSGGRDHKVRQVFNGIRDKDDWSYTIGVQGSIPIGNRSARGAYERAKMTQRQSEQQYKKTELDLILNVRLALRAAETGRTLVEANAQARALQEANVEAEEKRLRIGASTSFEVLRIQEDLAQAQVQELQAKINFEKALIDLQLAEGTLLENMGVEFAAPEPEPMIDFVRSLYPPEPGP